MARARVSLGSDVWVDTRDVAGISRGSGADALALTVHTFPPRGGVFRRRRRSGAHRVDHVLRFDSVVALIAARDRVLAECMPPSSLWNRPGSARKKLLVLLNPAAGRGDGVRAYERDVAPVLACLTSSRPVTAAAAAASDRRGKSPPASPSATNGDRVEVVTTREAGEARALIARLDLSLYAAVVCVGGDGTVAEAHDGLRARADADDPDVAGFPVAAIPAGSGNAVAKSLAEMRGEPCDATSAALAVVRGALHAVDCAEITEVDERAAGATAREGKRRDGTGTRGKLRGETSETPLDATRDPAAGGDERLDDVSEDDAIRAADADERLDESLAGDSSGDSDFASNDSHSAEEDPGSSSARKKAFAFRSVLSLSWGFIADVDIESERMRWLGGLRFFAQAVARVVFLRRYRGARVLFKPPAPDALEDDVAIEEHSSSDASNANSAALVARRVAKASSSVGSPIPNRPGWRAMPRHAQTVWALNLPWASEDANAAPAAEADDGAFDVLVVHERATRLDWLGLLLAVDSGTHAAHPAVSYVKAEELVVVPGRVAEKGKKGGRAGKAAAGCVSADGEVIARASGKGAPARYGGVRVRVRRGRTRAFVAEDGPGEGAIADAEANAA
jgi:diacylglycerol kinase family enzyme